MRKGSRGCGAAPLRASALGWALLCRRLRLRDHSTFGDFLRRIGGGAARRSFRFVAWEVAIGPATFRLTAIRVDLIRFGPDFRSDQDLHIYSEYDLSRTLDVISALVDVSERNFLQLKTGQNILWMVPSDTQ